MKASRNARHSAAKEIGAVTLMEIKVEAKSHRSELLPCLPMHTNCFFSQMRNRAMLTTDSYLT